MRDRAEESKFPVTPAERDPSGRKRMRDRAEENKLLVTPAAETPGGGRRMRDRERESKLSVTPAARQRRTAPTKPYLNHIFYIYFAIFMKTFSQKTSIFHKNSRKSCFFLYISARIKTFS